MLCGTGGIDVELHKKHAVALPPLNAGLARDLVTRSGLDPLLGRWRSRPAANEQALLDTLLKVSQMTCDLPAIAELDINPLLVDADGVVALDARVRLHRQVEAAAPLAIRPYPQNLEERVELAGSTLTVRPIRPEDGERLHAFYERATAADMRLRFFMARREVPHSELARYSQIDYDREMAFIAVAPPDGQGVQAMAGEVRARLRSRQPQGGVRHPDRDGLAGQGIGPPAAGQVGALSARARHGRDRGAVPAGEQRDGVTRAARGFRCASGAGFGHHEFAAAPGLKLNWRRTPDVQTHSCCRRRQQHLEPSGSSSLLQLDELANHERQSAMRLVRAQESCSRKRNRRGQCFPICKLGDAADGRLADRAYRVFGKEPLVAGDDDIREG